MNHEKFGDSYDFVKRGILQLLAGSGSWSVHPMFTDNNPAHYAVAYCRFIGVPAINTQSFEQVHRNRNNWLEAAEACPDHLLLDPDTGLPFDEDGMVPRNELGSAFLTPGELVRIVTARPDKLTLVFDQSFHRTTETIDQIEGKLGWLNGQGVHGLVYHSHATFFLASLNPQVLADTRRMLLAQLPVGNHPADRLIEV